MHAYLEYYIGKTLYLYLKLYLCLIHFVQYLANKICLCYSYSARHMSQIVL